MAARSKSERIVVVAAAVLGAYAFAVILWFTVFSRSWSDAAKRFERTRATYERERRTIAEREMWEERYEEEARAQMEAIMDEAQKICRKFEPDCQIVR